jgi:transcriptional regulator with XRE-family HTH domain
MITSPQIRAGRALLGWPARVLAEKSGVSYATVQRAEQGDGPPHLLTRNLAAIGSALERAGIVFVDDGVRRPFAATKAASPMPSTLPLEKTLDHFRSQQ